jgi:hypothetical protein
LTGHTPKAFYRPYAEGILSAIRRRHFYRPYAEGIFIGHTPKALANFSPRLELATTLGSRPIKSELTL